MLSFKNDAKDVTGVITLNSEYPERFWFIRKLSKGLPVSKSIPPRLIRFPSSYLIVNFPSLSLEVEFSSPISAMKLLFLSIKISAPLI